jgi:chitinase
VLVNGDTLIEANEPFTVSLSGPVNASIATGTGTGTILNDD